MVSGSWNVRPESSSTAVVFSKVGAAGSLPHAFDKVAGGAGTGAQAPRAICSGEASRSRGGTILGEADLGDRFRDRARRLPAAASRRSAADCAVRRVPGASGDVRSASARASGVASDGPFFVADSTQRVVAIRRADAPNIHYAGLDRDACEGELTRRGVPFVRGEITEGVRAPVRLRGPVRGVSIHSGLPPKERERSIYETFDCRLVLALDDFAGLIAQREVVEILVLHAGLLEDLLDARLADAAPARLPHERRHVFAAERLEADRRCCRLLRQGAHGRAKARQARRRRTVGAHHQQRRRAQLRREPGLGHPETWRGQGRPRASTRERWREPGSEAC